MKNQASLSFGFIGVTLITSSLILSGCFSSGAPNSAAFSKLPDPEISMDSLPTILRGGYNYKINVSTQAATRLTMNSINVELSQDGGNTYSLIATLPGDSTVFNWTTPTLDAANLKLRMVAFDNRKNQTSTESSAFEILSTPPQFSLAQSNQSISKERKAPLNGTCSSRWPVHLSTTFTDDKGNIVSGKTQTLDCSGGIWSLADGLTTSTDGVTSYILEQVDAVGNMTRVGGTWTSDASGPTDVQLSAVLAANDFSITGSGQSISSSINFIPISIEASDPLAGIKDFCLKYTSSQSIDPPQETDSCWIPLYRGDIVLADGSNSKKFKISKFTQRIGFTPGVYSISVWLRDNLGNVSSSSKSASDLSSLQVSYFPKLPPQIFNMLANLKPDTSYTNPSSGRPNPSDLTTTHGPVYIRWQSIENTTTNPLASNPINLYYTTDDVTYSRVPGAQGLSKDFVSGGCAIDSRFHTGCFAWSGTLPTGYFKIRLTARDINGQVTALSTNPINAGSINILAGNTDPGSGDLNGEADDNWGTSGASSMFFSNLSDARTSDAGSLVVLEDGTVFFKDKYRGILTVSPRDGVQRVFLKLNFSNSDNNRGDGKVVSQAWVKSPIRIALDWSPEGGLLIFDYDRIRRVDLKTLQISTLIGSAKPVAVEPSDLSNPIPADQVKFTAANASVAEEVSNIPLVPFPNGDIYFQSDKYRGSMATLRKYSKGYVSSIRVKGNTPSKLWQSNNTWTDFDCFGPVDQPNTCTAPNVPNTYFNFYNYTLGFGYDQKGQSILNTLILTFIHAHPTGRHGITAQLPLDSINTGEIEIPAKGMPTGPNYGHTGRDGRVYTFNRYAGTIQRFEPPSATAPQGKWTKLAGSGGIGSCEDTDKNGNPTLATQCKMDIQDVYVTVSGDVYFVDRGRIRTISDTGTIVTLFGQGYSYGDKNLAIAARFGSVKNIGQFVGSDGKTEIVALDTLESRIRSFKIGDTIQTMIGNGFNSSVNTSLTMTDPAQSIATLGVYPYDNFVIDPALGDVYFSQGAKLFRLNRSNNNGKVESVVGGGSNKYYLSSSDGKLGNQISISLDTGQSVDIPLVFGFGNGQLLAAISGQNNSTGKTIEAYLKTYTIAASFAQSTLAGSPTPASSLCADGTPLSSCNVPATSGNTYPIATNIPNSNSWLILNGSSNSKAIRQLTPGAPISTLTTATNAMTSFAYREIPASGSNPAKKVIYYCSTAGTLYSRVVNPAPSTPDTLLPWAVSSIKCTGKAMLYNSSRNSLIFPATQNQMFLITEYLLDN